MDGMGIHTRPFFVGIISCSILILTVFAAHAVFAQEGGDMSADLKCNPVVTKCECGEVPDSHGVCQYVGEKQNMNKCVCENDKRQVRGTCTAANFCTITLRKNAEGQWTSVDPVDKTFFQKTDTGWDKCILGDSGSTCTPLPPGVSPGSGNLQLSAPNPSEPTGGGTGTGGTPGQGTDESFRQLMYPTETTDLKDTVRGNLPAGNGTFGEVFQGLGKPTTLQPSSGLDANSGENGSGAAQNSVGLPTDTFGSAPVFAENAALKDPNVKSDADEIPWNKITFQEISKGPAETTKDLIANSEFATKETQVPQGLAANDRLSADILNTGDGRSISARGVESNQFTPQQLESIRDKPIEGVKYSVYDGREGTAYGGTNDPTKLTFASKELPEDARGLFYNPSTGDAVVAKSNDTGPFVGDRRIDATPATLSAVNVRGELGTFDMAYVGQFGPTGYLGKFDSIDEAISTYQEMNSPFAKTGDAQSYKIADALQNGSISEPQIDRSAVNVSDLDNFVPNDFNMSAAEIRNSVANYQDEITRNIDNADWPVDDKFAGLSKGFAGTDPFTPGSGPFESGFRTTLPPERPTIPLPPERPTIPLPPERPTALIDYFSGNNSGEWAKVALYENNANFFYGDNSAEFETVAANENLFSDNTGVDDENLIALSNDLANGQTAKEFSTIDTSNWPEPKTVDDLSYLDNFAPNDLLLSHEQIATDIRNDQAARSFGEEAATLPEAPTIPLPPERPVDWSAVAQGWEGMAAGSANENQALNAADQYLASFTNPLALSDAERQAGIDQMTQNIQNEQAINALNAQHDVPYSEPTVAVTLPPERPTQTINEEYANSVLNNFNNPYAIPHEEQQKLIDDMSNEIRFNANLATLDNFAPNDLLLSHEQIATDIRNDQAARSFGEEAATLPEAPTIPLPPERPVDWSAVAQGWEGMAAGSANENQALNAADQYLASFTNPLALSDAERQAGIDKTFSEDIGRANADNILNNFANPYAISPEEQQKMLDDMSNEIRFRENVAALDDFAPNDLLVSHADIRDNVGNISNDESLAFNYPPASAPIVPVEAYDFTYPPQSAPIVPVEAYDFTYPPAASLPQPEVVDYPPCGGPACEGQAFPAEQEPPKTTVPESPAPETVPLPPVRPVQPVQPTEEPKTEVVPLPRPAPQPKEVIFPVPAPEPKTVAPETPAPPVPKTNVTPPQARPPSAPSRTGGGELPQAPQAPSAPSGGGVSAPAAGGGIGGILSSLGQTFGQMLGKIFGGGGLSGLFGGANSNPAGQRFAQNTYCMTSLTPMVTYDIPAGTPFPSNCYNNPLDSGATLMQQPQALAQPAPAPVGQPTTPVGTPPTNPQTSSPTQNPSTPVPAVASVIANPPKVSKGSYTTLFWASVPSTNTCTLSTKGGTLITKGKSDGKATSSPLSTATTFVVSCTPVSGSPVSAETTVTIK